jgi:hypothetical protein
LELEDIFHRSPNLRHSGRAGAGLLRGLFKPFEQVVCDGFGLGQDFA